jgi:uncharacterized protein (TIGR01777 family)
MSDTSVATAGSQGIPPIPATVSPLRVVIPGGEGQLGRILARCFSARGHFVTTLSRAIGRVRPHESKENGAAWRSIGWDGKSIGAWAEALEHTDVLINLAERTVNCRYSAKNQDQILRSRVDSTRVLGRAIQKISGAPRVWLNASTATIYRHSFDREMDEAFGELGGNEPGVPDTWRFSVSVAQQWEGSFFRSPPVPHTRKICLRTAMVMAAEAGGVFEAVLRFARMGLGGGWGSGRQYMSWIHEADFVRAVEFLIEREEISGAVNLAAANPLPNEEFMSTLRKAWGIRIGLPAKEWMLELGAFCFRTETELLLKSWRVVPGVVRRHGFTFLFPTWAEAADDLVWRWRTRCELV